MSEQNNPDQPTTEAWIIKHRFRRGVYLGRDASPRDLPLLFRDPFDATRAIEQADPLLWPDWEVVSCVVMEAKR